MRAEYLGHMTASDSSVSTPANIPNKRGRKPKTGLHQVLAEARRNLVIAQERHEKALARVAQEENAALALRGRQIYLRVIEGMHVGERALLVDQVICDLAENDRLAVQAWMDSLAAQKKCVAEP